MIAGTAGHIDHGKSALLAALTGRPMDRLAEERRRGITIDLGFAPLDLGGGLVAGVVDVPGHEDFVRTMVAGAAGIDVALLVVAADEGIMPQTEEHLAILEHLHVPIGIPVLTKADLVEADWLELVAADLAERLRRSRVEFEPPVVTSAVTGRGIEELRARLADLARRLPPRREADLARVPVDRAFSVAGVGTVVTGTAWSGSVAVGDPVVLLPAGVHARVRSVENYGQPVARGRPGARIAIGLAGVERGAVGRGDVVVAEDAPWTAVTAVDARIRLEPGAPRPLVLRSRIRFHLGTAEVMARVHPRAPIAPGASGLARLALERPLVARGGDRFVLRSYSPVVTIGGGEVLDPVPPRSAPWPDELAADDPARRLSALILRRSAGAPADAIAVLSGLPPDAAERAARNDPRLRLLEDHWIAADRLEQAMHRAVEVLRAHHRTRPSDPGMPLETLRRAVKGPAWLADAAVEALRRERRVRAADGVAALAGFTPQVEGGDAEIDRIVGLIEEAALTPPTLAELERQTGRRDLASLLRLAAGRGRVEAVERDRYYARAALDRFEAALNDAGAGGEIVPAALRDRLGISRKYLIPLLEWADGRGITVRVGEIRRLRGKQQ